VGIASNGIYRVALGLVLAAPVTVALAQDARGRSPEWAAFDAYVAQSARDWRVPGMAIAVVHGDSLVFARGYGLRKVGAADRVDEHTRFAIGSTTKAIRHSGSIEPCPG
jgi:CubicO group peptidase (beta-lactamase class C family)